MGWVADRTHRPLATGRISSFACYHCTPLSPPSALTLRRARTGPTPSPTSSEVCGQRMLQPLPRFRWSSHATPCAVLKSPCCPSCEPIHTPPAPAPAPYTHPNPHPQPWPPTSSRPATGHSLSMPPLDPTPPLERWCCPSGGPKGAGAAYQLVPGINQLVGAAAPAACKMQQRSSRRLRSNEACRPNPPNPVQGPAHLLRLCVASHLCVGLWQLDHQLCHLRLGAGLLRT